MKKNITGKELLEIEKKLYDYQGEDRIVSSHELAKDLDKTKDSEFIIKTKVPSLDRILDGVEAGELIVVTGPTGEGKSLAKGTRVLMYNGKYKNVEDIEVGDKVMGKDSSPRNVLTVGHGREEMFEVTPVKGESFVCNKSHILSVLRTKQRKTNGKKWLEYYKTQVHLQDYMRMSKTQQHLTYLYRVPINFYPNEVEIDPYFLGVWLGDGHSDSQRITSADKEIVDSLAKYASNLGLKLTKTLQKDNQSNVYGISGKKGKKNNLLEMLRKCGLIKNKHIPHIYKVNSRKVRLNILAGLIDTDGYVNHCGYVFVNKNKTLSEDVLFIAQSLGFYAYIKLFKNKRFNETYYKVGISGDCSVIPVKIKRKIVSKRKQKKDILRTRIKSIKSQGMGEYYGITLDGDHEYLLHDFTVTHNTTLLMTLTKNIAEQNIATSWFTLEVTPRQFIKKITKSGGSLPLFYLPNKNLDNTIKWIEDRIVESKVKYNARVVFIDHIHQIFSLARISQNVSLEIGDMVSKIKQIAVEQNMIIFLIAHSKDDPSGTNREPRKEDIRDSGLISRLADSIIGIWRVPNDEKIDSTRRKTLEETDTKSKVRIFKNRREGKMSSFFMQHQNHYLVECETQREEPKNYKKSYKDDMDIDEEFNNI